MRKVRKFRSLIIIGLALGTTAQAQDYGAYSYPGTDFYANNNSINVAVMNDVISDMSTVKKAENPAPSSKAAARLEYRPLKSLTRKNLANFVEKTRVVDPASAAQLEQLFASTDFIGAVSDAMQGIGLRADNAAHAFAIYWVSAWQAAHGDHSTANAATYQAVSAQASNGLSNSSAFANATDEQKQEMAEALMIQAALIDGYMQAAAGKDDQLKAVAKAASQGAAASGLDLYKMTLTERWLCDKGSQCVVSSADQFPSWV